MFGTEANKIKYSNDRRVNTSFKSTLLNRAKKQYELVIDLGKGKYTIDKKREQDITQNMLKMLKEDIYYNLTPVILSKVKYEYETNSVLLLPLIGCYDYFKVVNKTNYNNIRYNQSSACEQLNLDHNTIKEYFEIVTRSLKYYLEYCLNVLKKEGCLDYQKIKYIREKSMTTEHCMDEVSGNVRMHDRRATPEEIQLNADIKKLIRDRLDIKNDNDCYKSKEFNSMYRQQLNSHGILFIYDCYEIVCCDIDKINYIMSIYSFDDLYEMSLKFSTIFEKITLDNANNRFIDKGKLYRIDEKYINDYLFLTSNTLYKNCDNLKLDTRPKVNVIGNSYSYSYNIKDNN